jgi:hypothetical protein
VPEINIDLMPSPGRLTFREIWYAEKNNVALAIGDPSTGKSAALRILAEHLGNLRDVVVGVLSRAQASLADFYRELGHLFSVPPGASQPMGQRQSSTGKVASLHRKLSVSSGAPDR